MMQKFGHLFTGRSMEIPEEYLNLLTDEEKYDEYILNKLND